MTTVAYAGIDLGTSGVKVLLVDEAGRRLGLAQQGYQLHRPEPAAAEADPADWWRAVCRAVRHAGEQCPQATVAGIGLSGQMHGLVLTAGDGTTVRPALTWADTRASADVQRWQALTAAQRTRLANPLVPGMTGPMLVRLMRTEPAAVQRTRWALTAKDWLRFRLTGAAATDPSDASATLLWDLPGDDWASDVLAAMQIRADLLPAVRPSAEPVGVLTAASADALGLAPGLPVACGAADAAAGLLATRLGPDQVQLTLGTGAQVVRLLTAPSPVDRPVTHTYRTAEVDGWYAMAAVQNFGLALDWTRRVLDADWTELYDALDASTDPRRLPVFVPYLTGERSPVISERVRGGWQQLDQSHTRTDLLRSAVVGAVCSVRDALDALPDGHGGVWLVGGGSRDLRLRQLVADILGREITPLLTSDASAWGAALLGAWAACAQLEPGEPEVGAVLSPTRQEIWTDVVGRHRQTATALVAAAERG